MPTGEASGLDVVDVDVHGERSGFGAFHAAYSAGLVSGWAWTVSTPSGGGHVYFPHGDVEQRSWTTPAAVDFRGDGGYVLVPPSRVRCEDGVVRGYELRDVATHFPAPVDAAALRRLLAPPRPASAPATELAVSPTHLGEWLASRRPGERNGALFWAACRMAEGGFDIASARDVLGPAAERAGLKAPEIVRTIDHAFGRAARDRASAAPASPSGGVPSQDRGGGRRRPAIRQGISR